MRIEIERIGEFNPIQDWTILRANKCTPSIGSIYMHPNLKFNYHIESAHITFQVPFYSCLNKIMIKIHIPFLFDRLVLIPKYYRRPSKQLFQE